MSLADPERKIKPYMPIEPVFASASHGFGYSVVTHTGGFVVIRPYLSSTPTVPTPLAATVNEETPTSSEPSTALARKRRKIDLGFVRHALSQLPSESDHERSRTKPEPSPSPSPSMDADRRLESPSLSAAALASASTPIVPRTSPAPPETASHEHRLHSGRAPRRRSSSSPGPDHTTTRSQAFRNDSPLGNIAYQHCSHLTKDKSERELDRAINLDSVRRNGTLSPCAVALYEGQKECVTKYVYKREMHCGLCNLEICMPCFNKAMGDSNWYSDFRKDCRKRTAGRGQGRLDL
ncbi:hypothetical protein LTR81_006030 [Elasticomyces elasticus]